MLVIRKMQKGRRDQVGEFLPDVANVAEKAR
jgi:hypothetical protein